MMGKLQISGESKWSNSYWVFICRDFFTTVTLTGSKFRTRQKAWSYFITQKTCYSNTKFFVRTTCHTEERNLTKQKTGYSKTLNFPCAQHVIQKHEIFVRIKTCLILNFPCAQHGNFTMKKQVIQKHYNFHAHNISYKNMKFLCS